MNYQQAAKLQRAHEGLGDLEELRRQLEAMEARMRVIEEWGQQAKKSRPTRTKQPTTGGTLWPTESPTTT